MTHNLPCFILCCTIILLVGCGPKGRSLKVEYVEGIVTFDGQSVPSAHVTFHPAAQRGTTESAGGVSRATGIYKLSSANGDPEKGAVAGDYIVTVSKVEVIDPNVGRSYEEVVTNPLPVTEKPFLPAVYATPDKTPLKVTVKPGKNKIDLELKNSP